MAKEKLLIIEDEASVAKQLKWSLEAYDISIAGDAQKARQLLASGAFPVATLDLGLPPSSDTPYEGFKLLEALGSLAPHTKVIVITGNAEQENAVKAVALGAECASLKAGRILFSQAAMAALPAEEWPGNVRELQNRIRRALSNCSGQRIMPEDLGLAESRMAQGEEKFRTLQEARDQAEEKCIRKALMMTGNNISQAAKLLGISRPTLHDLLKKHKIK